jgi:ferritin-like metal-binding protein YciE
MQMKIETLTDLFVNDLRDLYSGEHLILNALPKMASVTTSPRLKAAFEEYYEITKEQAQRLDTVFGILEVSPRGKHCRAIASLIEEGVELLDSKAESSITDAAFISVAQRILHYEMAGYGSVRTYASLLAQNRIAELLELTMDEEVDAAERLSELVEAVINHEIMQTV